MLDTANSLVYTPQAAAGVAAQSIHNHNGASSADLDHIIEGTNIRLVLPPGLLSVRMLVPVTLHMKVVVIGIAIEGD